MSFTGSLDDVPVVDLLQFIRIGGRTGTLVLQSGGDRAELGFHAGKICSARGPGTLRLGELLIAAGAMDSTMLDIALARQESEKLRRPLGKILVENGLAADAMYAAVRRQIQEVVQQVVGWKRGVFDFAPEQLRMLDELGPPGEVVPAIELDTQSALLEALQILDESARDAPPVPVDAAAAEPPPRLPAETPAPAPAGTTRVQVVSRDPELADRLAVLLEGALVTRVALREAGVAPPGGPAPLVVVDLRGGAASVEAIAGLRRTRKRAVILAVIDGAVTAEQAYRAGAVAAVPGDVDACASLMRNLLASREPFEDVGEAGREGLSRLRRVFADLRSGLLSTGISLSLMNVLAESVERCVLFLGRADSLVVLGAFGAGPGGRSLGQVTGGLKLEKGSSDVLSACMEDGEARVGSVGDGTMPESFFARIGKPRTGQFAVFPVVGGQRVIALVYVDNGVSSKAIEDLDVLELASAQAGLALENELLRREASRRS